MLYLTYILVACAVVFLSVKASVYIDLIDKKSSLSGAFLGGVLLSAVTSLPELFTSISATLLLAKPGLCLGNVLGSNIFNLVVLAVMFMLFLRSSQKARISRSHNFVIIFCLVTYVVIALNMLFPNILDYHLLSVSVTSLAIVLCYIFGVKYLSGEGGEESKQEGDDSSLTMRGIILRFVLCSVGLVGLSIWLTYLSDDLATTLGMGAGLAGALFLGVATSLPELSSTISLFRMRNYDIAVGNIVGSCLFNMIILTVADLLWFKGTIYDFSDGNVGEMLLFGGVAMLSMLVSLRCKSRWGRLLSSLLVVACYVAFLVL
jgi:cation:H+ antiporter